MRHLFYQSPHINLFESSEGALVGTYNGLGDIITSDLVRRKASHNEGKT